MTPSYALRLHAPSRLIRPSNESRFARWRLKLRDQFRNKTSQDNSPWHQRPMAQPNRLTDLPYNLFLDIVFYLSARDVLVCRHVSRDFHFALTQPDISKRLVQLHFPRSREARILRGTCAGGDRDWAATYARLVRRYEQLSRAVPYRIEKVTLAKDPNRLRGVTPWNRFLRLEDKTAPFEYWDPAWAFAPDDGLLVYPVDESGRIAYCARDLADGESCSVPFDPEGKVVRRVRLSHDILIFEWCEELGHLSLNEHETAHRHFATAFDVAKGDRREITFRSEWKIHYLGLPLSHQDRFFSTHNRNHYAVYIWQPTRSPWGGDEPLERLFVWELGEPQNYKPSLDPTGRNAPQNSNGPRLIRRLVNQELDAWGIRQRETPTLRSLALDDVTRDVDGVACGHIFVVQEEHRWCAGPHSSHTPPRHHRVLSTGVPILGDGPAWRDECGGKETNDDGENVDTSFCWRRQRQHDANDEWPGRAPCWRHDDYPYLSVSEVFDVAAGVRVTARQCFMMETLSVHVRPRLQLCVETDSSVDWKKPMGGRMSKGPSGWEVQFADDMWSEVMGKGCIFGDERWIVGEDRQGDVTVLFF